jgi:hypothetical protein
MAAQEQYVVDADGKKTAVILSLKRYRELMEDLHDLATVAERRNERGISLEAMKRRLKKDGILSGHPQALGREGPALAAQVARRVRFRAY